jgi:hypothetical protein
MKDVPLFARILADIHSIRPKGEEYGIEKFYD